MSTYYYDYYTSYSTYPTYPSTYYTTYYPTAGGSSSECLNYTYLIWVYFLYYVGAGYPSWYYPYIIATLLDLVPTECGGSGGTGGGIDSSLSLLSLFQNPIGGGLGGVGGGLGGGLGGSIYNSGSSGGSYVIYPGQSSYNNGYNSYSAGSNSLSQYGIQQPVIIPQSSGTNYGKRSADGDRYANSTTTISSMRIKRTIEKPLNIGEKNSLKTQDSPQKGPTKKRNKTTKKPAIRKSASLQFSKRPTKKSRVTVRTPTLTTRVSSKGKNFKSQKITKNKNKTKQKSFKSSSNKEKRKISRKK